MKLINKSAVVAEIERQIGLLKPFLGACAAQIVAEANDKLSVLEGLKNFLDTLEVEELPIWEKVSPDTGQTTLYKDGVKSYLERFGYRIDLKDLDKLPKKNSTHRTPADIESAMQEVEEKSEAYTNAHRGERDDDVLSQMRGEYVSNSVTAADRGTAEEIIINLKRVEQDYLIDLTKEIEWVRNKVKKGE